MDQNKGPDQFRVVNQRTPRVDAMEKATGSLKYTADLKVPGALHARALYSREAHARIRCIDTQEARGMPGVVCVATWEDVPGPQTIGEVIQDQYVFASDKVRYRGDVLAMVAAEDPKTAREALSRIRVEYEPLPVLDTMDRALEAVTVVHAERPDNICAHHHVRKGDVERGFAEADIVLEEEYETPFIEHSYIETEAVLAIPGPGDPELTVYGSIQNPFAVRRSLERVLQIPMARLKVIQPAIGGTFGGKLEIMEAMAVRAGLLATLTGRPVRLVNEREDSFTESHKRHPFRMKYRLGAKKDGTLCAIQVDILADAGAYACMTPYVTWRAAVQGCGPYNIENVHLDIRGVYTNNPYTGSMRGFGSPQVVFGVESALTELAARCGISPHEIRRINALKTGDHSTTNHHLTRHVVSVRQALETVTRGIGFDSKWERFGRPQGGRLRRGIGLACSLRGVALGAEGLDAGRASLSAEEDGSVILGIGLTEQGQGLRTAMCQIAAEALGVSLARIHCPVTETGRAPDSGPTVASRGTVMGGGAVREAAGKLQAVIREAVAVVHRVPPETVLFEDDRVRAGDAVLGFPEAVRCCYQIGATPSVVGTFIAPQVTWDEEKGCGEAYFTYVYAAQAAEVEVDVTTGKVDVLRVVAAHDVGRAINPDAVRGQIYGGVAMALGYALLEDLQVKEGEIRHRNFDEYLIPTALDLHEVTPVILENPDPDGPYGAKCIGEAANELTAAAIVAAVNQATGRTFRHIPVVLETAFLGCSLEKTAERGSESHG